MNLIEKIDQYFATVSDEQLLSDLEAAGFTVVPLAPNEFRVERTYTVMYSRKPQGYAMNTMKCREFSLESRCAS